MSRRPRQDQDRGGLGRLGGLPRDAGQEEREEEVTDNDELLRRFFDVFNEYQSEITGWPRHRTVQAKRGPRRWRMSHERLDAWFHRNFIRTDLMRANLKFEEFKDDGLISFDDYYRDFVRSECSYVWAVRRDFLAKVLALGCVRI